MPIFSSLCSSNKPTKQEKVVSASKNLYKLYGLEDGKDYKVYDIPQSGRSAKGKAIVNILPLAQYEKITAIQKVSKYDENLFVLMATSKGTIRNNSPAIEATDVKDKPKQLNAIETSRHKEQTHANSRGQSYCYKMGKHFHAL